MARSYTVSRSSNIDILRFAAMVAVIGQHSDILPFGWTGVWLFYVISGFVVTLTTETASGFRGFCHFFWKRLWRICPSYFLFLIVAVAALVMLHQPLSSGIIASAAFFQLNERMTLPLELWRESFPISHLWTISVEMQLYAALGIILVVCDRPVKMFVLSLIIVICPCLRVLAAITTDDPAKTWAIVQHSSLFQADAFASGALICLLRNKLNPGRARFILTIALAVGVMFSVFYVLMNAVYRGSHGIHLIQGIISGASVGQLREVIIYSVLILISSGLLATAYTSKSAASKVSSLISLLGRASYSGYLWHYAAITVVRSAMYSLDIPINSSWESVPFKLLLWLLSTALVAPFSLFMFTAFEKPVSIWGQRLWVGSTARSPAMSFIDRKSLD